MIAAFLISCTGRVKKISWWMALTLWSLIRQDIWKPRCLNLKTVQNLGHYMWTSTELGSLRKYETDSWTCISGILSKSGFHSSAWHFRKWNLCKWAQTGFITPICMRCKIMQAEEIKTQSGSTVLKTTNRHWLDFKHVKIGQEERLPGWPSHDETRVFRTDWFWESECCPVVLVHHQVDGEFDQAVGTVWRTLKNEASELWP
jgi:hypothetical protein